MTAVDEAVRCSVSSHAFIPASHGRVWPLIADYKKGHPRILPPKYFKSLVVEEGGVGAGTVIRFSMTLYGKTREMRAAVTEPEPGRVLVETGIGTDVVTTFRVDAKGPYTEVTISTDWTATQPGWRGKVERWLATRALRKVYAEELALLGACASALG